MSRLLNDSLSSFMYEKFAPESTIRLLVIESELIELLLVLMVRVVPFSSVSSTSDFTGRMVLSSFVIEERPYQLAFVFVDQVEEVESEFCANRQIILKVH